MEYTSLFFDLDNTLLDFNRSEAEAVSKVLKEYNLPYDGETVSLYSEINRSFWEQFECGKIEKQEIFEGRFKKLLSLLGQERDTAEISKKYCDNLSKCYHKVRNADGVLTYLKDKGYKIYATTNGFVFTQRNRIEKSGLKKYFDGVFISEEMGFQKPEKEYFDWVVSETCEKDRKRILIIGDSQSSDILGGINSGIDTCWFNCFEKTPKYRSKYEIKELEDLKKFL